MKDVDRRVLVTGGAGFIGSHLVDLLVGTGSQVVVLDDFSQCEQDSLARYDGGDRVLIARGSILDERMVARAMDGCGTVFHLAAVIGVRYIVDDPLRGMLTNVRGTEIVLAEAARRRARVLIASSSEVYGRGVATPFKEDDDLLIGPTVVPRWSYALSKGLDEHLALAYYRQYALLVSIVRPFNAYGPGCLSTGYGVVARFVERALLGQPLLIHGDGSQTRCFTYIDDMVRGTLAAGTMGEAIGGVFNIGAAHETTIESLARTVLRVTGSSSPLAYIPYEQDYGADFEDARRRVPDVTRAQNILAFRATIGLDEGLEATVAWWRKRLETRRTAGG